MAIVHLTSSSLYVDMDRTYALDELERMKSSASSDRFGVHSTTDDPAIADIILFVENCDTLTHWRELQDAPIYPRFVEKSFLFTRNDFPFPILPGIYPSISKRWYSPQRVRSGPYLVSFDTDFIRPDLSFADTPFLCSFVGKMSTDPVRRDLFSLESEQVFLKDTSPLWPYGELSDDERTKMQDDFVEVCHLSKFVLCPRGRGVSSIRLFESMRMARAPVIIADNWVPPDGPAWEQFSIRIPERDAASIPKVLSSYEQDAERMGRAAREAWTNWFSREATFHRSINWCVDIMQERHYSERILRFTLLKQLRDPTYLKMVARHFLRR